MSLSNNYPTIRPTLEFDFANVGALDPRITFTRATSATFVNQLGVIQTAASGIPRFDYDPSTLAARGLLIEEQRTNLVTYSEQFDNVAWTKAGSTITANAVTSPDGTVTADKLIEDSTNAAHYLFQTPTVATGTYSLSVYMKAAERSFGWLYANTGASAIAYFDLANGTIGTVSGTYSPTATITSVGSGWYRCTMTFAATNSNFPYGIGVASANGTNSYTGNGTSGILIWGAQLEAGSFATSYIPTVASTVTRNADVASVNTLSPWYQGGTAETWYAEIIYPRLINGTRFVATEAAATPYNTPLFNSGSTLAMFDGTSTRNFGTMSGSSSAQKVAVAYSGTTASGAVNGSVATGSFDGSMDSPTIVYLGGYTFGGYINGHLRRIAYYPARLTDAQLQALTS